MTIKRICLSPINACLELVDRVNKLRIDLYGSLALTGVGHGTPNAILVRPIY
jgi:hypothetical protein